MTATAKADQETDPASRLARALGVEDNELDRLEDFFVEAAAAKGAAARKIFRKLRRGVSLGRALEVPNAAVELLYSRAHRWCAVGRHDRAEPIFLALCVVKGESADFWTGLGICLRARSAWDEALAAFATASRQKPQWAVPHFHALELCVRRGAWVQAAAELAAFEQKTDNATHPSLTAEAGRYKKALLLRGHGSESGVSGP
jgi:tetratricopeptide (TPR) repeat protein